MASQSETLLSPSDVIHSSRTVYLTQPEPAAILIDDSDSEDSMDEPEPERTQISARGRKRQREDEPQTRRKRLRTSMASEASNNSEEEVIDLTSDRDVIDVETAPSASRIPVTPMTTRSASYPPPTPMNSLMRSFGVAAALDFFFSALPSSASLRGFHDDYDYLPQRAREPTESQPSQRSWLKVQRVDQRKTQNQNTDLSRRQMKERYQYIMGEVDTHCGNFIRGIQEPFQFMDVCCAPGGFSEYTLAINPNARGLGLSLNRKLGGHIACFESYNFRDSCPMPCVLKDEKRYHMHFVDVTTVAATFMCGPLLGPQGRPPKEAMFTDDPAVAKLAGCRNLCQLMILDGSVLGGKQHIHMEVSFKADWENPAFNCYVSFIAANQALLAAQLAIMAWNLKPGGDVVLRASMTWSHFTNGVLAMLRRVFKGTIQSYKPRSCHQDAISYYMVCRDFDLVAAEKLKFGPTFAQLVATLRSGAPAVNLVPFPQLPEGHSVESLEAVWGMAMQVYHLPLWMFRGLSEKAQVMMCPEVEPEIACKIKPKPCWKSLVYADTPAACRAEPGGCHHGAHATVDLHPFSVVAFNQVNSLLHMPQPTGELLPGQQHPRNEEAEVCHTVVNWMRSLYLDVYPDARTNPMVMAQLLQVVEPKGLKAAVLVWQHMLMYAGNMEQLQHFRVSSYALHHVRFLQSPLQRSLALGFESLGHRVMKGLPLTLQGHLAMPFSAAADLQARQMAPVQHQHTLHWQGTVGVLPAPFPSQSPSARAPPPGPSFPQTLKHTPAASQPVKVPGDDCSDAWLLSMLGDTLGDGSDFFAEDEENEDVQHWARLDTADGRDDGVAAMERELTASAMQLSGYHIPMVQVKAADAVSEQHLIAFLGG